jgi:hypothetical protein
MVVDVEANCGVRYGCDLCNDAEKVKMAIRRFRCGQGRAVIFI